MVWPIDKLSLINQQLALTGNESVPTADDGSDEWTVASAAYEFAFEYMLDRANWAQVTNLVALNPTSTPPADPEYDTAYAKPADCVHVIYCRQYQLNTQGTVPAPVTGTGYPINYTIVGNQIYVNNYAGATVGTTTPVTIMLKYVSSNNANQNMLRTFMTALGLFVQSGIYRGLHENTQAADASKKDAMVVLQEAMTRSAQEKPKTAMFNSRLVAARRIRRPWPPTPGGWSGTGSAG